MKKGFALLLVLILCAAIGGAALGEAELSYDGEVVAGESIPVTAPYGGLISVMIPRGNSWVKAGDESPDRRHGDRPVCRGRRRSGIHRGTVRRGALY